MAQPDYAHAEWRPSPNFWAGFDNRDFIVVHATASGDNATEYVPDFNAATGKSTHYAIAMDGHVVQYVEEKNSAWGNCCASGNSSFMSVPGYNWNKSTVSIENEKHSTDNSKPLTPVQYQSLLKLVRDIAKRWNIPLVHGVGGKQRGVVFHHDIDPVNRAGCPGNFPYDTFFQDLQGGQVTQHWYEFPWGVRFGTGDPGVGGAHDATILAPPNYEVTFPLSGTVVDLSAPSWGKQVGIKLDTPYNGAPYFAFLHLSALHPGLTIGRHVNKGDIAGWVGGANDPSHYAGTSNPTGDNFLDDPYMSSQVQVGFALMHGPVYGEGAGWTPAPDAALNPEQIIIDLRKSVTQTPNPGADPAFQQAYWTALTTVPSLQSGIGQQWSKDVAAGHWRGSPLRGEIIVKWKGVDVPVLLCQAGFYTWENAVAYWHPNS